jgi:hypothetical protein
VLLRLKNSSLVAPHARFSFQRTSIRPVRRTDKISQVVSLVNPRHPTTQPFCPPFKEQPATSAGTHFIDDPRQAVNPSPTRSGIRGPGSGVGETHEVPATSYVCGGRGAAMADPSRDERTRPAKASERASPPANRPPLVDDLASVHHPVAVEESGREARVIRHDAQARTYSKRCERRAIAARHNAVLLGQADDP